MTGAYPETPGSKGKVETGHIAAARFAPKAGTRQSEALNALERLGVASAEEVAVVTGRHWYVTRPRLSELAAMGLIADSGSRGKGAMGGTVVRWRLTTQAERDACKADAGAAR